MGLDKEDLIGGRTLVQKKKLVGRNATADFPLASDLALPLQFPISPLFPTSLEN